MNDAAKRHVRDRDVAASLRRNEQGVTENSCVPRSVVNNDDGVPVALSQNVMTKHRGRREGATLGTHSKVWPVEWTDARCVGEWGGREGAPPGARAYAALAAAAAAEDFEACFAAAEKARARLGAAREAAEEAHRSREGEERARRDAKDARENL